MQLSAFAGIGKPRLPTYLAEAFGRGATHVTFSRDEVEAIANRIAELTAAGGIVSGISEADPRLSDSRYLPPEDPADVLDHIQARAEALGERLSSLAARPDHGTVALTSLTDNY